MVTLVISSSNSSNNNNNNGNNNDNNGNKYIATNFLDFFLKKRAKYGELEINCESLLFLKFC